LIANKFTTHCMLNTKLFAASEGYDYVVLRMRDLLCYDRNA